MENPLVILRAIDFIAPEIRGEPVLITRMILGPHSNPKSDTYGFKALYNVWHVSGKPSNPKNILKSIKSYDDLVRNELQVQTLIHDNRNSLIQLIHDSFPESVGCRSNFSSLILDKVNFTAWWQSKGHHGVSVIDKLIDLS